MTKYSALYIEEEAASHPHGRTLIGRFADRPVIFVASHGEVFYRAHQDFQAQKRRPALVAAVARPPFLYRAPSYVAGAGDVPVFYTDQLRNCRYNCDYCFLQGMHPSGHTLVFVNTEEYRAAAASRAASERIWLSISYLTDIAAFEATLPLVGEWITFARSTPKATIEIRTKGATPSWIDAEPVDNVVLVWTLSPRAVVTRYEGGTAPLEQRLQAARHAAERGWRVRIAVDPVVLVPGWRAAYASMLDHVFSVLDAQAIEAATYGVFRMGRDYLHRIAAARADSPIVHHPFHRSGRLMTYSPAEIDAVHRFVGAELARRLPSEKVAFVHG